MISSLDANVMPTMCPIPRHILTAMLLCLLAAVFTRAVELEVANFDFGGEFGSAGASLSKLGSNRFRIQLSHAPNHPEWPNLCQFTLTGAAGASLRLEGASAGLRQFGSWSYDRVNWNPVIPDGSGGITFPQFTRDTIYFGCEVPFSHEMIIEHLAAWESHPDATIHYLGDSLQGRPIYRLTVADPSGPYAEESRWVHHFVNQHTDEGNAIWRIAGAVDWLLSEEGAACRRTSVSHFVLTINPDGPANGYRRTNTQGIDMNRAFSVTGWQNSPAHESGLVQKDMETLDKIGNGLTTTFSMHTWEGPTVDTMLRPGDEMGTVVGSWTEFRDLLSANDAQKLFSSLTALTDTPTPTHWTSGTHVEFGTSAFCVEGGAALYTKDQNLAAGAILMETLHDFYGTPPVPLPGSSNYAETVAAHGPAVYFRLSEPAGQAAGAPLQNDGTILSLGATWGVAGSADSAPASGAVGLHSGTLVHGRPLAGFESDNTAARFTGRSIADADLLEIGKTPALDTSRFTFSCWFKADSAMESWARLYATDPAYANFFQIVMNEGHFYLATNPDNGAADVARNLDLAFDDGAWHHLAAVRDGVDAANAAIYIDGEAIPLEAYDGFFSGGTSTRVGARTTGSHAFFGMMDEIALWRRALDPAEILAIYEAAFTSGPLPGDLNGDGRVDSADLDGIRAAWGNTTAPGDVAAGDISGDGVVGSADLDLVRANWGRSLRAAAVPEPGMAMLAGLLGTIMLARRRW